MLNNIRALREKKGLSQETLANAAEISRPYLSDVERGVSTPGADVASRICDALAESFEAVFRITDADATRIQELTETEMRRREVHDNRRQAGRDSGLSVL